MARESVLIRIMGNIGDAVCAEPAIRQHLRLNGHLDHYIQSRCPELYSDYPGIIESYHIEDQIARSQCTHFRKAKPDWHSHIVDYLANTFKYSLADRTPNFRHIKDEDLSELSLPFRFFEPVVAFSVKPSNNIRAWDRDKWQELVVRVKQYGYRTIQLDTETEPLDNIDIELVNQTTIRQAMTILKYCKMLITVDSGLSHCAAAVSTPCICLFGPVDPEIRAHADLTYPVKSKACQHCLPTYKGIKSCPLKHHNCMKSISVNDVMNEVAKLD